MVTVIDHLAGCKLGPVDAFCWCCAQLISAGTMRGVAEASYEVQTLRHNRLKTKFISPLTSIYLHPLSNAKTMENTKNSTRQKRLHFYCVPAATENLYTSEKKKEVLYPSWYRKEEKSILSQLVQGENIFSQLVTGKKYFVPARTRKKKYILSQLVQERKYFIPAGTREKRNILSQLVQEFFLSQLV